MANANKHNKRRTAIKNITPQPQTTIKCYQINLQHSRTATDNLMELIEKEGIDVAFIQEPYTVHNRGAGISKMYRTFTSTVGRCRTATVYTNNQIDALLIKETTDKGTVVVELIIGSLKFYTANMYLDITRKLEKDIELINEILQLANTSGILIMMDSKSRSKTLHDKLTNGRRKELQAFLISKQLFIINEKCEMEILKVAEGL